MTFWRIWRADRVEAETLAALEAQAFGEMSWGRESLTATFDARNVVVEFGGYEIGVPLGFVIWRVAADEVEVLSIGVLPAVRREGLAGALLLHLFKTAEKTGVSQIFLEVDRGNAAAVRLYSQSGFAQVAERSSYYRNGADALVMRKSLKE